MEKFAKKICENKNIILIITGILFLLSIVGIKLTKINYDILVYLPKEIETVRGQNILTNDFGMGAYSVVLADNLNSKEILNLEEEFRNIKGVNQVISAYDALGNTIPIDMLPSEITDKIHKDNSDLIFVTFRESTSSLSTINAIDEMKKIANDKVKISGMSAMVLDTMNLSNKEIFIYVVIAVALCLLVLELSLDSYFVPLLLLGNIGIAIIFNLGSNIIFGEISYITKALVAVLQPGVTTDFSIFLYHSYEDKKNKGMKNMDAMQQAIVDTTSSVIGSSLTTIAGFLVLCTMNLTLGKDLGLVMAKGVFLGVISVLTIFPSLILISDKLINKTKHKPFTIYFEKLNKFVIKHHGGIFALFIILIIPAYLANSKVGVYYKIDESLPDTLDSIVANAELKDKFNIVSPEIILIDKDMKSDDVNKMVDEIRGVDGIDLVLSFSKLKSMGLTEDMLPSGLVKVFESDNYQMMFINSTYDIATTELNNQVGKINNIIKKYDSRAILAGEGPLMKDLVNTSDEDFKNVNYSSIICILIIMVIVLKSLSLPILLISAIEFAIFINMAVSYFGGVTLPFVAPIVLGTIQLGATIDYAILMTTNYIRLRVSGIKKKEAMLETTNYCSNSIFVSGMCFFAATFGVGLYSDLEMVGSLCTLISRGAIISMIVVIFVLPSILLIFDKLIMKTTIKNKDMKESGDMKNKKLKVACSILVLSLLIPMNTYALSKDETVYTKLNSDGSIKSTIVNEHLTNDNKKDKLEDISDLENILNINSNHDYIKNGNNITWNSNGSDIFYQGTLNKSLPITTNITYKLDGKEISLDDLIGKEGHVSITLKYINNDLHVGSGKSKNYRLYTPFVVTTATIIPNDNNSNIKVINGKVVNNGSNYVVVGLSTPGLYQSLGYSELKSLDKVEISFDTKKFELSSIYSVITPKLIESSDLDIFNKLDSVYGSINTLQSSMDKIEDGSNNILKNLGTIDDGSKQISSNLSVVASKLKEISNGASDIKSGLEQILNSLKSAKAGLNSSDNTERIKAIKMLIASNKDTISKLEEGNKKLAVAYEKYNLESYDYATLATANLDLYNLKYSYENSYKSNESMIMLLTKNNEALSTSLATFSQTSTQINDLIDTLSIYLERLESGSEALAAGTKKLSSGVSILSNKMQELSNGTSKLYNGMSTLNNGIEDINSKGINTLSNYANNVSNLTSKMEGLVDLSNEYSSVTKTSKDIKSNTKIIMVVDGVKVKEEKTNINSVTKKETIWDRIMNLFK